jgi:TatD DNase family protein
LQLIDTHCHLDVEEFTADRMAVLAAARMRGVEGIVVPAIARRGWSALLALCDGEPDLYPALGLHPVYIADHSEADLAALEPAVHAARPVAIGEIGLDWMVEGLDRERQMAFFQAQIAVAGRCDLPVLLHVRKAHDEVLRVLKGAGLQGGIAHAFNGSLEQGLRYHALGFRLGFGGMLTFERSRHLRELAAALPLDAIVLETDAPDLTPVQHRGERNSPAYLPHVLAALAEVRTEGPLKLAAATTANARSVLRLGMVAEAAVPDVH